MIQVRNVPDDLHRELARRARTRGLTLTAYLQQLLEREVARPDPRDAIRRLRELEPVTLDERIGDLVRRERGDRDEEWLRRAAEFGPTEPDHR